MSRNTIQTPGEYIIRNVVPVLLIMSDYLHKILWKEQTLVDVEGEVGCELPNDHIQNTKSRAHILFTIGSYIKIYVRLSTKLVYL